MDRSKYWNQAEMFAKVPDDSYEDWEGFSDNEELMTTYQKAGGNELLGMWFEFRDYPDTEEMVKFGRDQVLHYMHTCANEGERAPTEEETTVLIDFMGHMLTCNRRMRSDVS